MKIAFISDVHGNLQALESVLNDIKKLKMDRTIFLGDAVGYGANPNETVQMIADSCEVSILGNHDAGALGEAQLAYFNEYAKEALMYTLSELTETSRATLSGYEPLRQVEGMLLTHATPARPMEWNYCLSLLQAAEQFRHFEAQVCFIGHSHFPIIFSRNGTDTVRVIPPEDHTFETNHKYLINVGSVGQPRDGDPRSCYAIFETDEKKLSYRRVAYDVGSAQQAMAERGLPEFLIQRLARGK